jgi:hypothetical protein
MPAVASNTRVCKTEDFIARRPEQVPRSLSRRSSARMALEYNLIAPTALTLGKRDCLKVDSSNMILRSLNSLNPQSCPQAWCVTQEAAILECDRKCCSNERLQDLSRTLYALCMPQASRSEKARRMHCNMVHTGNGSLPYWIAEAPAAVVSSLVSRSITGGMAGIDCAV